MRSASDPATFIKSLPHQLYIDGRWTDAADGTTFVVLDPATGEALTEVADAQVSDGAAALDAAVRAQPAWAKVPPRERGEILRRAFELMLRRADDFALAMTREMGKPLKDAGAEVVYAADFLRWYSEEAVRVAGSYRVAPDGGSRLLTMKQPVGPTVMITPWNFPLAMGTRKAGPAIAAGCTMVMKPAGLTPLSMLMFAELLEDAGLPPGVFNVITTSRTSAVTGPLIDDPRTRKLTFTGSTGVGRQLLQQAAGQVLKVSMELGGNAPFIVFPDADLDAAVDGAMIAKMRNMGEACTAANRFLVHENVVPEFTKRLSSRMGALRVGDGTLEGVDVGPLVDRASQEAMKALVDDAVALGATLLLGGSPVDGPGFFFPPTVLSDVPAGARAMTEEIFGPIAPVATFRDEDEVVARANATEFGLAAYVYTRDIGRAIRVSEALEFGMVGVNQGFVSNAAAPFGGVKASGLGREGGSEGIDEYLETKYVGMTV